MATAIATQDKSHRKVLTTSQRLRKACLSWKAVRVICTVVFVVVLCLPACFAALSEEVRTVNLGQSFDISLPFQSGTGTRWILAAPQSFQVGSKVETPKQGAPGAAANQKFTLTPTKPGDYSLVWKLVRPGSEPFQQYQLNVHVE